MKIFGFWLNDVVFAIGGTFLVGIAVANMGFAFAALFWWTIVIATGVFLLFQHVGLWKLLVAAVLLFLLGIFYFQFFENAVTAETHLIFDKKINFSATVIDEPAPSEKFLIVSAEAEPPFAGRFTILAPPTSVIGYGDELKLYGKISPPKMLGDDSLAYMPQIEITSHHRASWIREKLINLKNAALRIFEWSLPRDEAGLLGGIAFGSKVDLSADLKRALSASGTTHLIAVSGYNITIVLYAVERALGGFIMRRKMLAAALGLVILFVLMTGIQPSAVRAAIMGFILVFAGEMGGGMNLDTRNALVLTAVAMTLFDPTLPVRNLGFQLSFLSLAGIVYLETPLKQLFRIKDDGAFGWKVSAITTLAAQLAVWPILSAAFGGSSATSIFANVMVLGTVPVTMFFGFILAAAGFVSQYLAFGLAAIIHLLLAYQISAIKFWGGLAVPLRFPLSAWIIAPLYYLCLLWLVAAMRSKEKMIKT